MQLKVILLEVCIKGIKGLLGCQFTETGSGESVREWENKNQDRERGGEKDWSINESIISPHLLVMGVFTVNNGISLGRAISLINI